MREFAKSFYKSRNWQQIREFCMSRDHRLCQDCLRQGRYTPAEEVHHIIELTAENITDPAISLNPENLISLCRECHKARHERRNRRFTVDELGRVRAK